MRLKQILPAVVAAILVNGQDPRWTGTRFITVHPDQYLQRRTEGTWVRSKDVQQTRWEGHFSKMHGLGQSTGVKQPGIWSECEWFIKVRVQGS